MTDIIGPILAIALVFIVYYISQQIDVSGETKIAKLELEKIDADTKREAIALRRREVEVEMGQLAIEAKKLEMLDFNPGNATEAEFRVVKKLEDKEK